MDQRAAVLRIHLAFPVRDLAGNALEFKRFRNPTGSPPADGPAAASPFGHRPRRHGDGIWRRRVDPVA